MNRTFAYTKIALGLIAACSMLAIAAQAQPVTTQGQRGGLTVSPYTKTVNCPDAAKLVVDITPATLPAGWSPTHTQLELRSVEAAPSQWPAGKQMLACHYKAKDCTGCSGGQDTLILKRTVELGSCMNSIPGQPRTSFLCKPGTAE